MKKTIILLALGLFISLGFRAQAQVLNRIQWLSFEQAIDMNSKRVEEGLPPKMIFIDIYTDWCGWCKKLDQSTFINPEIVSYVQQNFLAVKLNAERRDTVRLNGKVYVNANPPGRRGTHDLANMLLKGNMSYPSCTFIDQSGKQLSVIPGYHDAKEFEEIIHYFGDGDYQTEKFEDFQKTFKGKVKP